MTQNLFKPTYLKELCKEHNLSPSKKYGQNYLISKGVVDKIINAANLEKTDTVVEIGPGFGVLTFAMAPLVERVIAFEIEKKLLNYWEEKQDDFKNIEIVWGNALKKFTVHSSQFGRKYKVVANLPYQITSNALRVILEAENKPEFVVVMVQKEVAERIIAKPGDMSLLSVSVQYFGEPKIVAKVAKGNFWPAPKVESAILSIKTYKHTNIETSNKFFRVVKAGFRNKRKQLWRNLAVGLHLEGDNVKPILKEIVGNEKVRAEELSVEQWRQVVKNHLRNKQKSL